MDAVSPFPKRKGSAGLSLNPEKRKRQLANLKPPFPPGTNGYNPGRMSLTERLRHQLAKTLPEEVPKDMSAADQLVLATIRGALSREPTPFKEVWDRLEGKLSQDMALTGAITVNIISKVPRPEAKAGDKPE